MPTQEAARSRKNGERQFSGVLGHAAKKAPHVHHRECSALQEKLSAILKKNCFEANWRSRFGFFWDSATFHLLTSPTSCNFYESELNFIGRVLRSHSSSAQPFLNVVSEKSLQALSITHSARTFPRFFHDAVVVSF